MPNPLAPPSQDDDEIPKYDPLTTLLSGSAWQPKDADANSQAMPLLAGHTWQPQDDPSQAQSQAVTPVAQQAAAPQASQPVTAQAPGSSLAPMPLPPTPYQPDIEKHLAIEKSAGLDGTPTDRKANGPKWYDRVAGGLVGFGTGYKEGPSAGIRAGSAVTNRGYDAAEADRQTRLAADNAAMDTLNRKDAEGVKGYEAQVTNYKAQLDGRNVTDAESRDAAEQAARTAEAARQAARDKQQQENFNADLKLRQDTHGDQTKHESDALAETVRHDKAGESISSRDGGGSGGSSSDMSNLTPNQKRLEDERHDSEYARQQGAYQKAKKDAGTDATKLAQAEADNNAARGALQARWNQRYSEIYPHGRATAGGQGTPPPQTPALPPLTNYKEGDSIYGKGGEKYTVKGGKWTQG